MLDRLYDMDEKFNCLQQTGIVSFENLLSDKIIDNLERCYDAIIEGNYASGNPPPRRTSSPEDSYKKLTRVSFPTVPNPALAGILMEAGIGIIASKLMSSEFVQGFFIHLVNKVPGNGVDYNISWHQDGQYGKNLFTENWITAHIVLDDVNENDAPILYIKDSHRVEPLDKREISGFSFRQPLDKLGNDFSEKIDIDWDVKTYLSKKGDVTFHDSRLIHATDNITSGKVRKTFVLHLRGSHNKLLFSDPIYVTNEPPQPSYYVDIKDTLMCPVLHGIATDILSTRY